MLRTKYYTFNIFHLQDTHHPAHPSTPSKTNATTKSFPEVAEWLTCSRVTSCSLRALRALPTLWTASWSAPPWFLLHVCFEIWRALPHAFCISLSLSLSNKLFKGKRKNRRRKRTKHKTQEEGCSKYLQSGRGVKSPYSAFVFDCSTL